MYHNFKSNDAEISLGPGYLCQWILA